MSISGVGSSNPWGNDWASILKARASKGAAQADAATTAVGQLGQSTVLSPQPAVQSVTSSSGMAMNTTDADAFGQQMSALGDALSSGDVQKARAAFSQLQGTLHSAGVHHHHGHHKGAAAAGSRTDITGSAQGSQSTDPFAAAFGQVGDALGNGDVASAQAAFDSLRTSLATTSTSLVDGAAPDGTRIGFDARA